MHDPSQRPGKPWFLRDSPHTALSSDAFGHADIASNLLAMIRENSTDRLMISLSGEFGVGKSTAIEFLRSSVHGDPLLSVVRLSAERHESSGFHRSLVFSFAEKLVDENLIDQTSASQLLESLEYSASQTATDLASMPTMRFARWLTNVAGRLLRRFVYWFAGAAAVVITLGVILTAAGVDFWSVIISWLGTLVLAITIGGSFVSSLWFVARSGTHAGLFRSGQISKVRPRVEAPDEYERTFALLVEAVKTRLVVAVDDIDRLSQSEVLGALNAVRSFQLACRTDRRPIFIVSVDEAVVTAAIQRHPDRVASVSGATEDAAAYLDRLFVLRQPIPPLASADMRDFALSKLDPDVLAGAAILEPELSAIVAILIHDGVANPRHVIRLINAFFADFRLASARERRTGLKSIAAREVTSHPQVLARLVVLKVDFPNYFEQLRRETELLFATERLVRGEVISTDHAKLQAAGLMDEPGRVGNQNPLLDFVGRTSWVEHVDDLLPFMYLGQDQIERSVGSAEARRVRRMLVNGQSAEFDSYLAGLAATPPEHLALIGDLIAATLSAAPHYELTNALRVLSDTFVSLPDGIRPRVADAFGTALASTNVAGLRSDALVKLAGASTGPRLRATYIERLMNPKGQEDTPRWASAILAHFEEVCAIGNEEEVRTFIGSRIAGLGAVGSPDDAEVWMTGLPSETPPDLAEPLAMSVLHTLSTTADQPSETFNAALIALLRGGARSLDMKLISDEAREIVFYTPHSASASAALRYFLLLETDPHSIATASQMLAPLAAATHPAPYRILDDLTRVFRRTLLDAREYGEGTGADRRWVSTCIARFLAKRLANVDEIRDVSWEAMLALAETGRAADLAPLVDPLLRLWGSSDNADPRDVANTRTLGYLVQHVDLLSNGDADKVVEALTEALLPGRSEARRNVALALSRDLESPRKGAGQAARIANLPQQSLVKSDEEPVSIPDR